MAKHTRNATLETRTARSKLPISKKPVFVRIGPGLALGYRRNQTTGAWVARVADGKGSHWTKAIGHADDFEQANGGTVLDFWQAQDRARTIGQGGKDRDADGADDGRLITVEQALERYEADLKTRGGDLGNVARVRVHLSAALAGKTVALLTARDLRQWRDSLTKKELAPSSINRSSACFKACLNLAADQDARIVNHRAWEKGLATIPDAGEARNVVLPEPDVLRVIDFAHQVGPEFGILVEVAAVTGARVSQIAKLEVQDVQGDRVDSRLMMPTSQKGRGKKKISRRPVPIPISLIARLHRTVGARAPDARLLTKSSGEPWKKSDHTRLFQRAAKQAGLDPTVVTIYALRHSSIVRQLLARVPTRVVSVNHDTSVQMIEKNYSRYIADHSDAVTRGALLDPSIPRLAVNNNVVPLAREAGRG